VKFSENAQGRLYKHVFKAYFKLLSLCKRKLKFEYFLTIISFSHENENVELWHDGK
jgi:hypothetical protein